MITVLPKDLEIKGVRYLAGQEVDIDKSTYDYLMKSVVAERIIERSKLNEVEKRGKK